MGHKRTIRVTVSVECDQTGRCAFERFDVIPPVTDAMLGALYNAAFARMLRQSPILPKNVSRPESPPESA